MLGTPPSHKFGRDAVCINIGCGPIYAPGWINLDTSDDQRVRRDLHGSILSLPFDDSSVDAAYAGHVLEHVPLQSVPAALGEVFRVLKPGAEFGVVGPDFMAQQPHGDWLYAVYGTKRWPGDFHEWACTGYLLRRFLTYASFTGINEVPVAAMPPYFPVAGRELPWQAALVCCKPSDMTTHA